MKRTKKEVSSKSFMLAKHVLLISGTIYSSDSNEVYKNRVIIDDNFRKVHQFEVYLKCDEIKTRIIRIKHRIFFNVRFIPDNTEAKFEARFDSKLGKKIPKFCYKDEFLVANISDDRQRIVVNDLIAESIYTL